MKNTIKRRDFLKIAALSGVGLVMNPQNVFSKGISTKASKDKVSIAIIGVGNRGRHLMNLVSKEENVIIQAICDINPIAIEQSLIILKNNGHEKVQVYSDNVYAYRKILERKDIDGVIIATPWDWHVPMTVEAMHAKKYVGLEVPAAMTIEDCWKLVDTYEETGTNLMFLENCCYDRECMAVLQMIRDNLFGIPMHATCGYRHSGYGNPGWLRTGINEKSEADYRFEALKKNADQYPTHGIGPVANWFDINRGNQFSYLTSVSTKSKAINEFVKNHPEGGPNHPNATRIFNQGDIVSSIVKTVKGETIIINYDTKLPRPYSRDYSLQGTNGTWGGLYLNRGLYFEGKSPKDKWEKEKEYDVYMEKYDHPMWKNHYAKAQNAGHGGIDYFTIKEFVDCVKENKYPPIDVYDAAAWSVIIPLSEMSLAKGSTPEYFPDFTRGKWKTRKPTFGL